MNTLQIGLVFILAGVCDLFTTLTGLNIGLIESNPRFLMFPFMATIFLLIWSLFVERIKAYSIVKKLVTVWMVILAFVPAIWNSYQIFMVIL